MAYHESKKLRSGFYENKLQRRLTAPCLSIVCAVLVSGAFWIGLTSSLDFMTEKDCRAGIVKACEALK